MRCIDVLGAPSAFKIPIILVLSSTRIIRQVIRFSTATTGHNNQHQYNRRILQVKPVKYIWIDFFDAFAGPCRRQGIK